MEQTFLMKWTKEDEGANYLNIYDTNLRKFIFLGRE